jgi:hypothetical protein
LHLQGHVAELIEERAMPPWATSTWVRLVVVTRIADPYRPSDWRRQGALSKI